MSKHTKVRLVVSIGLLISYIVPDYPQLGLLANAIWLWGD